MSASKHRVRGGLKVVYGFGLSVEGIKTNTFNFFLFFYYQQIVGLHPLLCSAALAISLIVDAVMDPLIGVWSDGWRSKLGRRHPFMFAASLPLALCFVAVFMPPVGAAQATLFGWLTLFTIGTRVAMSLFTIPHQSLVAELTSDYDERTSLQNLRTFFGWVFGLINAVLAYLVFLRDTKEYPQGLLNPNGYLPLAVWGGCFMFVATLTSSIGTRKAAIAAQPDASRFRSLPLKDIPKTILLALRSADYRIIFLVGLCKSINYGVTDNLNTYVNTFFWGFTSTQISFFIVVIFLAAFTVLAGVGPLVRRYSKRNVAMVAALVPAFVWPTMVTLRIAGILPPSGSTKLFTMVCCAVFLIYTSVIAGLTMIGAMIADITDERELRTGNREEGLLFSANAFMMKASSGVGTVVAGIVVAIVGFPKGAKLGSVDPGVVTNLGAFYVVPTFVLGLCAFVLLRRYTLSRERHAEILVQLEKMRASPGSA